MGSHEMPSDERETWQLFDLSVHPNDDHEGQAAMRIAPCSDGHKSATKRASSLWAVGKW